MNVRTYLSRIKRRIFKKPFLKDRRYPAYWFNKVLGQQEAYVIQIGSNDGKTGDPLYQLLHQNVQWRGLFVEPVPYIFERLKKNYPDPGRFRFQQVAINNGQKLDFFWVDPSAKDHLNDLPYWYDQLGSFNKQHILQELGPELEPFIRSDSLVGMTLQALLDTHEVPHFDILHIDTEGHDWAILSQLDLKKYSPAFILYEFNHLSRDDLRDSIDFLETKYALFDMGIDILAVNRSIEAVHLAHMKKYMNPVKGS